MPKKKKPERWKSQKAYLKSYGHCPKCNSTNITGDSLDVDGNTVAQKVSCQEPGCNAVWVDYYTLTSYEKVRE